MGGRATNADMQFKGTFGVYKPATMHNYYMENLFGEAKLMKVGVVLCTGLIVLMAGAVYMGVLL
jgi:ech hydrogenase subunit A